MALSSGRAALHMARLFLDNTVLRKTTLWWVLALVIELAIAWAVDRFGHAAASRTFRELTAGLVFGFTIPFMALHYGTAVVRDEVEAGTLTYLLIRPIPRGAFYLSRQEVASALILVFAVVATLGNLVLLDPNISGTQLLRIGAALVLGTAWYVTVFAGIGALFKRPFLIGTIYILLFELTVSGLGITAKYATVRANLLNIAGLEAPGTGLLAGLNKPLAIWESVSLVCIMWALVFGIGLFVFSRREYTPDTTNQA